MNSLALDSGEIDRIVQSTDDTMITTTKSEKFTSEGSKGDIPLREAILDVIQGGVQKDARIVPSTGLDADSLVD